MNTDSHDFHYDSDLIGGSLMVRESRIVADLLLADVDDAAWKSAILDDNRLQKARPATAKRKRSSYDVVDLLHVTQRP
ncbi:BrxA family protein, partial [Halomonas sp.]|uniref:BrxA family protein n=1 Tax=Halomonas sp. TaxID=1486246 RepID=UPI003F927B21